MYLRICCFAFVFSILLTACTIPMPVAPKSSLNKPPSEYELANADYGLPPSENYGEQVRAVMEKRLKDPESARYRFSSPDKEWIPRHHFDPDVKGQPSRHGQLFGWRVDFGVNAKNSYGGFTGEKSYMAFFEDGQIRGIFKPSDREDIFGYSYWWLVTKVPHSSNQELPSIGRPSD